MAVNFQAGERETRFEQKREHVAGLRVTSDGEGVTMVVDSDLDCLHENLFVKLI